MPSLECRDVVPVCIFSPPLVGRVQRPKHASHYRSHCSPHPQGTLTVQIPLEDDTEQRETVSRVALCVTPVCYMLVCSHDFNQNTAVNPIYALVL